MTDKEPILPPTFLPVPPLLPPERKGLIPMEARRTESLRYPTRKNHAKRRPGKKGCGLSR